MMRKGYNFKPMCQSQEHYAVRKAMNRHLANVRIVYARHSSADLRKGFYQFQRSTRLSDEALSDAWVALTIPSRSFLEFDFCGLDDL